MKHKNPVHEAIYRTVVKPAMTSRKMSIEGSIMRVNYYNNTARIYWRDPDSGAVRESENVPLPVDGDGVYKQTVEAGDRVTLAFRSGNHDNPYVTIVHKKQNGVDYEAKNGAGIPKEITPVPNRKWKNALLDLKYQHGITNHGSKDADDYLIKEYEVALKHSETGAVVKLTDDGLIDVFAGREVGVRIDPHNKSVNLFGDSVNVVANHFNVETRDSGVIKPKVKYSEGMVNIMKDLGLPVETVDKEDN
jgi:hypothetical protein